MIDPKHYPELQRKLFNDIQASLPYLVTESDEDYFMDEFLAYLERSDTAYTTFRKLSQVNYHSLNSESTGYNLYIQIADFCEEYGITIAGFRASLEKSSLAHVFDATHLNKGLLSLLDSQQAESTLMWAEDLYFTDHLEYDDQLRSRSWKSLRRRLVAERGNCCQRCSGNKILQLHHKEYREGLRAWEYEDEVFEVLCLKCHQQEHKEKIQADKKKHIVKVEQVYEKKTKKTHGPGVGVLEDLKKMGHTILVDLVQQKGVRSTVASCRIYIQITKQATFSLMDMNKNEFIQFAHSYQGGDWGYQEYRNIIIVFRDERCELTTKGARRKYAEIMKGETPKFKEISPESFEMIRWD